MPGRSLREKGTGMTEARRSPGPALAVSSSLRQVSLDLRTTELGPGKRHVAKHHGAWGDGRFSGRKGCDIFLEGDTEALGKELSFLASGSMSQTHPAREPRAHSARPPSSSPPRSLASRSKSWG